MVSHRLTGPASASRGPLSQPARGRLERAGAVTGSLARAHRLSNFQHADTDITDTTGSN